MAGKSTKDLTEGSPLKLILGFAVPLIGGMLFQQLYSMVDTMIVGRALGVEALAGVGSTGSVNFMILGFCQGTCTGFSVPIAQKFGAKDEKGLRRFVANSIYLAAAMAVIVTLTVTLLLRHILTWMNTPENVFDYAYGYIFIIFLGIPTIILYNLASGIIRALGDSKAPVVFLVIASGMNIAGDLFLILVLRMGVAGAALATVISQLFSGILSLIYIYRKIPVLRLGREDMRPDPGIMRTLVTMGVPMGLQFSVTAIGSVILQTAVNGLGSVYVATMTAAARVSFFFNVPLEAMGSTMATYTGQNIGAKRLDRLTAGLKDASILGLSYCAAAYLVLFFLAPVEDHHRPDLISRDLELHQPADVLASRLAEDHHDVDIPHAVHLKIQDPPGPDHVKIPIFMQAEIPGVDIEIAPMLPVITDQPADPSHRAEPRAVIGPDDDRQLVSIKERVIEPVKIGRVPLLVALFHDLQFVMYQSSFFFVHGVVLIHWFCIRSLPDRLNHCRRACSITVYSRLSHCPRTGTGCPPRPH